LLLQYSIFLKIVVEDWNEHDSITEKSNHIHLAGDKSYNIKIEYFLGSQRSTVRPFLSIQWELLDNNQFEEAVELAKSSDVIIFAGGITVQLEGEGMRVNYDGFHGGDRKNLNLPEVQEVLLKALYSIGKPIVLVLSSGSGLAVNWENENYR